MSEDGIDFAEYDSPEDVPIHPRSFGKIAEEIEQLITNYDFAFSRLQESVDECDKRQRDAVAARVRWERRRERYAQWANTQPRLKQAAGRPGPQYLCEACWPDICVWFPWKFWLRNCPRVDWPLPLKDGEMERYEKETILAAIYDFSMKGGRRIADGLNLEHYDKLTGINLPGSRYDGLVKQIPVKHLYHLERWLKQFKKDLQFLAAKGVSGVQGGRAAPASAASKTGQGETPPDVTPVADQPEAGDATPIKRPPDNAIAAWRLRDLEGLKSQGQIAKRMSQELGKKVSQGTVSRWLEQVHNYLQAGNVLPELPGLISRPRTIDPSKLDLGERTDGRPPHQRQKRTHNSD